MKIKELFSYKSRWCQHSYAKNAKGDPCLPKDKDAVSWCLVGAVYECYSKNEDFDRIFRLFHSHWGMVSASTFNDESSFEEVKAFVEKLDI